MALKTTQIPTQKEPRLVFGGKEAGGVGLSTHIQLVQTFRMSGIVFLLPIYALMFWTEKVYL